MSSEHLASAKNHLKGDLGGSWNILDGASAQYTDLGIARKFGGSAAAYSLRDIGAVGKRVVKVRRDVDGDGTDKEEDFSASQVQSGALEDFVNGKLENTLPADVATAAAAYSLRKVKASYAEDAVRIRRIDNTEVDVAFDSDGKVSTSSSITNVESGDVDNTDETILGNFLQGEADVRASYNNASYSPDDSFWRADPQLDLGTGAFSIKCDVVFTGSFGTNTARLCQTFDSSSFFAFTTSTNLLFKINGQSTSNVTLSQTLQLGRLYNIEILRDSSDVITIKVDGTTVGTKDNTSGRNDGQVTIGRIAGFRLRGFAKNWNFNNGQHIYAGDGIETSNWLDTGSGTTTNLSKVDSDGAGSGSAIVAFTGQGINSFVHTWYDQAGSNDATQTTSANQPKIAESGTLLTDGLDFDGSSSYLDATSALGATATVGAFIVHKPDGTDANRYLIDNRDASNDGMRIMQREESSGNYRVSMDTTEVNSASGSVTTNETLLTAIQSSTALTLFKNSASQDTAADDAISVTAAFRIGANRVSLGTYFDGTMKEIILFTSDETDNRFKIESNINNHYGLYTFQGDGFVETWYDQSGNGNDATQSTAGSQPKIVENGSFVTSESGEKTIKFIGSSLSSGSYGVGNFLAANSLASTFSGDNKTISSFLVSSSVENNTNGVMFGFGRSSNDNPKLLGLYHSGGKIGVQFRADDNTSQTHQTTIAYSANTDLLYTIIRPSTTADLIKDGTVGQDDVNVDVGDTTFDRFSIGVLTRTGNALFLNGTVSELIIYSTDQGSDRTEIETDINNYYNIYS